MQHMHYWSCSKFADWLRGTPKINSGTNKEWREWRKVAKTAHLFRYWFAEEALDKVQDFICFIPDKINSVRNYIDNRFIVKTHALVAKPQHIPRGEWQDVDHRLLPCLFDTLIDFVEIEMAWMHVAFDKDERKKHNLPWWREQWWTRWFVQWRNPEAGLSHLDWKIGLKRDDNWVSKDDPLYGKPTPQAEAAKEIKELYIWWTQLYPNRPDPHDISGWSALCDKRWAKNEDNDDILPGLEDESDEERKETDEVLKRCHEIEYQYHAEDEEMMIRLIRIRHSLWT